MRPVLILSFILLLPRSAAAGALVVQQPLTALVPTTQHLIDMCATSGTSHACTQFVAYKLEASCYETGRGWALVASATSRPYIVLRNMHSLAREGEHIGGEESSLTRAR